MDWFAPGVPPSGRHLVVPHAAVIEYEDGKICSEHIYWDHATVLKQLGLHRGSTRDSQRSELARRIDSSTLMRPRTKS